MLPSTFSLVHLRIGVFSTTEWVDSVWSLYCWWYFRLDVLCNAFFLQQSFNLTIIFVTIWRIISSCKNVFNIFSITSDIYKINFLYYLSLIRKNFHKADKLCSSVCDLQTYFFYVWKMYFSSSLLLVFLVFWYYHYL